MQFRVPQNITLEDHIAGPLTAIQFGIAIVGGGISFALLSSQSIPKPLNEGLGGLGALITLIFIFGKFNDQPLYRFFGHILSFVFAPKVRIWHKEGEEIKLVRPSTPKAAAHRHSAKKVSRDDLAGLALVMDSRGTAGAPPPPKQHPS